MNALYAPAPAPEAREQTASSADDQRAADTPSGSAAAKAAEGRQANEVRARQGRLLIEKTPVVACGNVANALLVVLLLWTTASKPLLVAWLGAIWIPVGIQVWRWWQRRHHPLAKAASVRLLQRSVFWSVLLGSVWGAAGVIFFPADPPILQVFLIFVLGGMSTAAVATLASAPITAIAFIVPCVLPIIVRLGLVGEVVQAFMAAMLLLYTTATLFAVRINYLALVDAVRSQLDKDDLVERLAEAQEKLEIRVAERTAELTSANGRLLKEIAERRQAETALRQNAELLTAIFENSPVEIWLKDAGGRHIMVSRQSERLFGSPERPVKGATAHDIFPKECADAHVKHDRAVIESGRTIEREYQIAINGEVHTFLSVKFPLPDNAGDKAVIGAITSDITELKRHEEQLQQSQKMEAVGQLTGGVAHDFNNLLTVITGSLELLADKGPLGEDQRDLLQTANNASARGALLTQRLLAFSRKQALNPKVVDLNQLVDGMTDLIRRTLDETIEIDVRVSESSWRILADPVHVENALLNLAINARDAMPDGGRLTIETTNVSLRAREVIDLEEAKPGEYVRLSVSDTGIGMSRDVLAHAFEPFFTTKEVGRGSGLGLSTVYGFVKQSGGHVNIESEPGLGTRVSLYLPREKLENGEMEVNAVDSVLLAVDGEVVLVVEDDPDVRTVALTVLKSLGYRVLEAEHGRSALEHLAAEPKVDLLFTDVVLPGGMSGIDLAREAQHRYPGLKTLFASGYATEVLEQTSGWQAEMVLVNKPYKRVDLSRALRQVLER